MAYTPIYTPKNFTDWGPPDLDASNLNDIEAALVSLGNGLQTAAADTDTNTATIATINGEISDLNNLIDSILPDDSESGNPAVITDAFGGECKSLILTLEPIQSGSGTPSPANPRPITGRTQSTITRTNRNALPFVNEQKAQSGLTVTPKDGGRYDFTGTSLANTAIQLLITADLHGVYKFIADAYTQTSGSNISLYVQDKGGGNLAAISPNTDIDFDVKEVVSLAFYAGTGAVCNYLDVGFGLIPDAVTDKSFEPYDAESITRVYGETVYGVTDRCTGAGATKTKGLYIPSVTSVGYSASAGCNYADCHGITIVEDSDTICNMYDQIPYGNTGADGKYKVYPSAITIYDSRFTDVATAQAILNSCQIVYPLYTPVLIPLTPQNLTLLKGDNVITTDADNIDVEYKADIALYIAKQLGGNLGNRGAKSAPAEDPDDDPKEEEKTDDEIIEPVTKEAKK